MGITAVRRSAGWPSTTGCSQGTFDPTSLAPLARLMASATSSSVPICSTRRYLTARTLPTAAQFNPAPARPEPAGSAFGPPASPTHLGPARRRADPRAVGGPRRIRQTSRSTAVTEPPIDPPGRGPRNSRWSSPGNGDRARRRRVGRSAQRSADRALPKVISTPTPRPSGRPSAPGADLVLTDTNRRRAERWDTITQNTGYTEAGPVSPPPEPRSEQQSPAAVPRGDRQLSDRHRARWDSPRYKGLQLRQPRLLHTRQPAPNLAMDGDLSSAWEVAAFSKGGRPRGSTSGST